MKILFYILFFFIFFIKIASIQSINVSGKHLNLIVEDDLQYPVSLLINKFVSNSNLVINARYVNRDYIKNLSHDDSINIIITQNRNKEFLKENFNIKSDVFFGNSSYCLCSHKDRKLFGYNYSSMNNLFKKNVFENISIGSHNSNFFVGELLTLIFALSLR